MRLRIALTGLMLLAGCGSSDGKSTPTTTALPTTTSGCRRVARPRPKPDGELDRPSLRIDTAARWTAHLQGYEAMTILADHTVLTTARFPRVS